MKRKDRDGKTFVDCSICGTMFAPAEWVLQIEGEDVKEVSKNSNVGVLLPHKVRKNDFVYKLVERSQQ